MAMTWIETFYGDDKPWAAATAPDGVHWIVQFWGELGRHGPTWCILRNGERLQRPLDHMILLPSMDDAKRAVEWCVEHSPCPGAGCVDGFVPMPAFMVGHVKPFRDVCPRCEGSALDGPVPGRVLM